MRILSIAALIAVLCGSGVVFAADDSLDKAAKKTGDGFGNLLKGMGQELKKTGIGDQKKDDKKASKSGDSQSKEDKK
jgi:hypothetical protein